MKKIFVYLMLILLVLQTFGCATVQKKFTRKKKEPKYMPAVIPLEEGTYQKKYSRDYYYKNHYTLWRSWHGDLLNELGKNSKKVKRSADESFGQLSGMSCYLVPEKQAELKPLLDLFASVLKKMPSGRVISGQESSVHADLEQIQRIVANDFYYDKVKDYILPDKVDLGDSSSSPSPTKTA